MNEASEIATARAQAIVVESLVCLAIFTALAYSVIRIWLS